MQKLTLQEIKNKSNYLDYSFSDHFNDLILKGIEQQRGTVEFFKFLKTTPLSVLICRFFGDHMHTLNFYEKHCRSFEFIIDELEEKENFEDQIQEFRKSQGVPRYVALVILVFLFYFEDLRKSTRRLWRE